jgi:hypothetical protein
MAYREYTDSSGAAWKVWNTAPVPGAVLSSVMRDGWLTFECDGERRRLAPVPPDWEQLTAAELERLCGAATSAPRGTPDRGTAAPPERGEAGT